jgi:chemotaxis protein histidine kinase CheA
MGMAMNTPAANEMLLALRRKYAAGLPAKVAKAAESVRSLLAAPLDPDRCEAAHRSLHSLTGSSGTYGYPDLSRFARSAEILLRLSLESGNPISSEEQQSLVDVIARLGTLAAMAAEDSTAGAA